MGRQIYFTEVNEESTDELFRFFGNGNLVLLFTSLYDIVKSIIPDVIIRGIPGETFGVSRQRERCVFYVFVLVRHIKNAAESKPAFRCVS